MTPMTFVENEEPDVQLKCSKKSKVLPDEQPNGMYGLVINGQSLVRRVLWRALGRGLGQSQGREIERPSWA